MLFLLGLTGVGKSTAVSALQNSGIPLTLLPNRRTLTDELIVPEMQREAGSAVKPVKDRLERFELTRRYRKTHPGGMVDALLEYLETHSCDNQATLFDNLRGLEEAEAAVQAFPEARFVLLDAPPLVRLLRLVGRKDNFDQVSAQGLKSTSFTEQLFATEKLDTLFDPHGLALLAAQGTPRRDILKAVHIILGEAQHYDMDAAAAYLQKTKTDKDFLQLGTADLSPAEVQTRIRTWL